MSNLLPYNLFGYVPLLIGVLYVLLLVSAVVPAAHHEYIQREHVFELQSVCTVTLHYCGKGSQVIFAEVHTLNGQSHLYAIFRVLNKMDTSNTYM